MFVDTSFVFVSCFDCVSQPTKNYGYYATSLKFAVRLLISLKNTEH